MRVVIRLIAALAVAGSMTVATAAVATTGEPGSSQPTARFHAPTASEKHAKPARAGECPADRVCFYPGAHYRGAPTIINPDNLPGCDDAPRARSIYNATHEPYKMYAGVDCDKRNYLGTLHASNGWRVLSGAVGSWTNLWG